MKRPDTLKLARRAMAPLLAVFMFMSSGSAFALASGSVVFDPTNWAENLRSALMAVKQYAQDIIRTKHMFDQLQHAIRNRDNLLAGVLYEGMEDQQKHATREAVRYYDDLMSLEKDLESLQGRYDLKVNSAFNAKMTVTEFMKLSRQEASRGVKASQQSLDQDVKTLKRVQETYQSIQTWQAQADANYGHQQSLQLMNTQMNALVGQNAEIITALTKASMERTIGEVKARESEDQTSARHQALAAEARKSLQAAEQELQSKLKNIGSVRKDDK